MDRINMGNENITSKRVLSNMIWRFAERSGAQLVSFIVTIIIARIVDPEAYGIVAIISVFTNILYVFVDSGLGNALIQKKDSDNLDFSTVFYTSIFMCTILYTILFFCAPFIADFYNNSQMTILVRVSGMLLPISGIKNVQHAYISKHLMFRKFFFATLGGTIGSAIVGIWMALAGYGVWALVVSGLFNSIVDMIILWITIDWRPQIVFSFSRLRHLFSFGSRILLANITQAIYSNMYDLIIGKVYTAADLAYYNKGKHIPNIIVNNIDDSINSVMLPVMSKSQDDTDSLRKIASRTLKTNTYAMTPFLIGLVAVAEPMIRLMLTEKWMPAVVFLRIFAITRIFRPIATMNLNVMKALGRSDLFFKLEMWKDAVGIVLLLFTIRRSVQAVAIGILVSAVLSTVINTWPSRRLFGYGLEKQLYDLFPTFLLSVVMGITVYCVQYIGLCDIVTLFVQVLVGIAVYVIGSKIFKLESYYYFIDIIKKLVKPEQSTKER